MKVIAFAQSKGGVGKSTSCLITAQVLAHQGKKVCVLDADPNNLLVNWKASAETSIEVIGDINENNLIKTINSLDGYDYVFIDLEGKASLLTSRAILKSDFVVIPMQASLPDASQANRIINLIHDDQDIIGKEIKHSFLMTRTSPLIKTKIENKIVSQIKGIDYPMFNNQLNERIAFKAIFFNKCTLYNLPEDVSGKEKAIKNAEEFVQELVEKANV